MNPDLTCRRGGPRRGAAVRVITAGLALTVAVLGAATALAQEPLTCGVPISRTLPPGGVHTYQITTLPGTAVLIQSSAVSMALGPIHMRLTGPGGFSSDTCTGIMQFPGRAGDLTLQVSQCSGTTGGDYTLTLNIVSDGAGNCGRLLKCGATPDGTGFKVPGEVDAFQIPLVADQEAILKVNYLETLHSGEPGAPYLRLFDPDGNQVEPGRCTGMIEVEPEVSGIYTALISTCGAPERRTYRIEYFDPTCPIGPTITHFGITDATSAPLPPSGSDAAGRPIYSAAFGQGLSLVVEARPGVSELRPGDSTVPYLAAGTEQDPDLQMILSNALGNGDPAVCDVVQPLLGGVPATVPFAFPAAGLPEDVRNHVSDMGCRFDNGAGKPVGRRDPLTACTRTNQGFGFSFVDRSSKIQYCAQIATAWEFLDGDTIVGARVKDIRGNFGAAREIVVRIGNTPTPTPTASPTPIATRTATRTSTATRKATSTPPSVLPSSTATRTSTRTRTPSETPSSPTPTATGPTPTVTITPTVDGSICAGDCNGSRMVSVDEITLMLNIAFGDAALAQCPAADANRDGSVAIGDLVQAVTSSLNGCPVTGAS